MRISDWSSDVCSSDLRNGLLTTQSVLLARRKLLTDPDDWFSAKPRRYVPERGKSQLQFAAEQVALLERDLEEDKAAIGRERFFELDYEDLCRDADGDRKSTRLNSSH